MSEAFSATSSFVVTAGTKKHSIKQGSNLATPARIIIGFTTVLRLLQKEHLNANTANTPNPTHPSRLKHPHTQVQNICISYSYQYLLPPPVLPSSSSHPFTPSHFRTCGIILQVLSVCRTVPYEKRNASYVCAGGCVCLKIGVFRAGNCYFH